MEQMMPRELGEKWIAALRSGEYKQGKLQLKDFPSKNSYCCLGVLCDLAGMEIDPRGDRILVEGEDEGYMPLRNLIGEKAVNILWAMNDGTAEIGKKSFSEIADWIEEHIKFV